MQIKSIGSNIEIGESLTKYVEEHIEKNVKKYFENAIDAQIHFSKEAKEYSVVILINEGVKGGITIKSDSKSYDIYKAFNKALEKASKQLRRYKRKIKDN